MTSLWRIVVTWPSSMSTSGLRHLRTLYEMCRKRLIPETLLELGIESGRGCGQKMWGLITVIIKPENKSDENVEKC